MVGSGRTLDFVVFGVPRSGTTALVHAINAEPSIFCGHEVFRDSHRIDHAKLPVPDVFLDPAHPAVQPQKARRSMRVLRDKMGNGPISPVVHFGNKQPLYYKSLDHVNARLPQLRNLCIYRSPFEFLPSWDRRAGVEDDNWDPGRVGLFGLYEWLLMLARLSEAPYALRLVDYRKLFFGEPRLILEVLAFLGVTTPDAAFEAEFRAKVFRGDAPVVPREPSAYDDVLRRLDVPAVDAMIADQRFANPARIAAELRDAVEQRADAVVDHIAAAIAADPRPEVLGYGKRWCRFTLSHWDNPDRWAHARLRGDLVRLMDRLVRIEPHVGSQDMRSFVAQLRRPEGDRAAAARLTQLSEELAPGALAVSAGPRSARPAVPRTPLPGEAFRRARDLASAGQLAEALLEARRAVEGAPQRVQYGLFLARLLMRSGNFAAAATALDAPIAASPDHPKLHLQRSQALARARRRVEALAAARRAAELAPGDVEVQAWLARIDATGPEKTAPR